MKINVFLTAFSNGQIRVVEVPDEECNGDLNFRLNRIFWHGQNEAHPQKICSVSAGDIIHYNQKYYLILMVGFLEISKTQLERFKKLDSAEKMKYLIGLEKS